MAKKAQSPEQAPAGPLLVTAMGLASSLGSDLEAACAAARAGILRVAETEAFQVWNQHEGGVEGVEVHAAHPTTFGFEGSGRLIALLRAAWLDLERRTQPEIPAPKPGPCFLAFGDRGRTAQGIDLVEDEELREGLEAQAAEREPAAENARLARMLGDSLARLAGPTAARVEAFPAGHCGFLEAVDLAGRALAAGEADRAFVGAVDSLLDEETLAWLFACERLKHPAQPVGLMPGEAAVFAVVRKAEAVPPRQRDQALAKIGPVLTAEEPEPVLGAFPGKGAGLAGLLRRMVEEQGPGALRWIASDHNGETYRAAEWGTAVCRLRGEHPEIAETKLWLPAVHFGDTGAASAGLALARMGQSFARGYSPAPAGIILAAAEGGARAGITANQTQPRRG